MVDPQLPIDPAGVAVGIGAALACLAAVAPVVIARRRGRVGRPGATVRALLVGVAVASALGVAVVGGVRSFEAVSIRFGSPLVPLTADGMIVACTSLRIAALTKGWRIPGALATTYLFIGGTVWLNVAAAHDWSDAVAHALAPISYAILVEMLAHLLRLHLHLVTPPRQRVAALAWATSPVVTTRVWLHLARTGTDDPVAVRALVQQLVRLSSRLRMVCPGRWPWPFGQHRRTRSAALQVVRDGLLTAQQLAELLPSDGQRLPPAMLLARVDKAALRCTQRPASGASASSASKAPPMDAPTAPSPEAPEAGAPGAADAPEAGAPGAADAPEAAATVAADALEVGRGDARRRPRRGQGSGGRAPQGPSGPADGRSDAELVAELRRIGGPMAVRKVQRLLGVGWPRAKRLVDLAGWSDPTAQRVIVNTHPVHGHQPTETDEAETESTDQPEPTTSP